MCTNNIRSATPDVSENIEAEKIDIFNLSKLYIETRRSNGKKANINSKGNALQLYIEWPLVL